MNETLNELGQPVGFLIPQWQIPNHPPREPIVGHYCRLEPLDPDRHTQDLYSANAEDKDNRGWTYQPYGPFPVIEEYRKWMILKCVSNDPLFFAIVDPILDKAIGLASYVRIDPANGSIEVGEIHYSPLLQNTTAGTEAMYLMMARAFELGYRRYEWRCDFLNTRSRAAAQRLGLTFEGVFRQARVIKNHNRDTVWYSAIDREWPFLLSAFQQWLDPSNFDQQGRQRLRLSELTASALKRSREFVQEKNSRADVVCEI